MDYIAEAFDAMASGEKLPIHKYTKRRHNVGHITPDKLLGRLNVNFYGVEYKGQAIMISDLVQLAQFHKAVVTYSHNLQTCVLTFKSMKSQEHHWFPTQIMTWGPMGAFA